MTSTHKYPILLTVVAKKLPVRASVVQHSLKYMSLVEVMRLLNQMEAEGSVKSIVENEVVLWTANEGYGKWLEKLERTEHEAPVDGDASKGAEDKAGDHSGDPAVPVPEPQN